MQTPRWRFLISITCVILITTVGVKASDVWDGGGASVITSWLPKAVADCPSGMALVETALTFRCVDIFEASPADTCVYLNPEMKDQSFSNTEDANCQSQSKAGVLPWRFLSRSDAVLACARAGKRLPTAAEWYSASIGTSVENCNVSSPNSEPTGNRPLCVSVYGMESMIGNVWEWVSTDVIDGQYNSRSLPAAGYITQIDSGGVPTLTSSDQPQYTNSLGYLWSQPIGAFGMIRGGYYSSKSDAGSATIQAETSPNFAGAAIGFRCVK